MKAIASSALLAASTVFVSTTSAQQTNLCFRIDYDKNKVTDSFDKLSVVRPIKGFPANHAKVLNGYCGGARAGDPIPSGKKGCTDCKFGANTDFALCGVDESCITPPFDGCRGDQGYVNAGSMFYAYNNPYGSSSNIGYDKAEATNVYFVQDAANEVWLVLQHDKPSNADGGTVRLAIESAGLNGRSYVAQQDDPSGQAYLSVGSRDLCNSATNDCFAWDHQIGAGTFYWRWVECCTDGMVLGPMPNNDFHINLTYSDMTGLNEYRIATFEEQSNDLLFSKLTKTNFTRGIRVVGQTCERFCNSLDSCQLCTSITEPTEGGFLPTCTWGKSLADPNGPAQCFSRYDFDKLQSRDGQCTGTFTDTPFATVPPTSPTSPTAQSLSPSSSPSSPTSSGASVAPTQSPNNNDNNLPPTFPAVSGATGAAGTTAFGFFVILVSATLLCA